MKMTMLVRIGIMGWASTDLDHQTPFAGIIAWYDLDSLPFSSIAFLGYHEVG
jgi:hypothetical protein